MFFEESWPILGQQRRDRPGSGHRRALLTAALTGAGVAAGTLLSGFGDHVLIKAAGALLLAVAYGGLAYRIYKAGMVEGRRLEREAKVRRTRR